MPDHPTTQADLAMRMARTLLGDGIRIIGASLSGNARASDAGGGRIRLSTGQGEPGATATTYLDIDFLPDRDALDLAFGFEADAIPIDAPGRFLDMGLSVWVNGAPVRHRVAASERRSAGTPALPVAGEAANIRVGLVGRIGLRPGEANSLRIATAALGTAAIVSVLTVAPAGAAPGGVPGNPNNNNNGNDNIVGNADNANSQGNGPGGNGGTGGGTEATPAAADNTTSPSAGMVANDDSVEVVENGSTVLNLIANDFAPGQSGIFIISINGQPVEVGDTVVLSTGETITINEDGTVTITADGDPSDFTFEYTAAYGVGNANQRDTATVTVTTVPCFVAGTMIRTDRGDMPVERLEVGQLVMTRDEGLQPIRWIGRRTLAAEGRMAPVRIARDTFGEHAALMVSPLHRLLIRNEHAELLFGTHEVLAAARDLIDGRNVRQVEGGLVHYVHLLFDRHQVIWSEGLPSESFLPGPQTTHCFEEETVAEICEIFPELDPRTGAGYGPAARPALKRHEARLLVA